MPKAGAYAHRLGRPETAQPNRKMGSESTPDPKKGAKDKNLDPTPLGAAGLRVFGSQTGLLHPELGPLLLPCGLEQLCGPLGEDGV